MKMRFTLMAFLLNTFVIVNLFAQSLPLVYSVENTGANYPKPPLPTIDQLPAIANLPDPFLWADGRGKISSIYDWMYRRNEIGAQIQNYEIGEKPVRPDTITASYSAGVLSVNITKNGKTLVLTSQVSLPTGTGPFAAVIGMNSPSGSIPSTIFTTRNIARITFNHNQVTVYGNPQNSNPYYQLYPYLNTSNTGQYSAWAWGVSRIIDGLELVQKDLPIDLKHIAVTGCSYAGKMALIAGAFDERVALTISQESGGGGYTTWRVSETLGAVETLRATDYNWFKDDMKQFANSVPKLPEDHHELMAMVAPRALLVTGNPDYLWLADESGHVGSKAAKEVYKALGIPDRFGYSIVAGHLHCQVPSSQTPEIETFVDRFLLDKNVSTDVATTPFKTNLSSWITWTTPTLSTTQSSLSWTSLVSPANLITGTNKNVTLKWKKATGAVKYYVQLSNDPLFASVAIFDSTTGDTVKSVSNLLDGKKYYWRVQVKNTSGATGPWSNAWNFSTYIALPAKTQLISALPLPNRQGYFTFTWKKAKDADKYVIQLSDEKAFASYLMVDSVSADTSKTLSSIYEGLTYYWRVQSKNVSGSGPWSDITRFSSLIAPSDLVLKRSALKEITLTWTDNSLSENGFIIERKQNPQTTFALLDTLKVSGSTYIDKRVEQALTYTYRVKAYNRFTESDYSNESSLLVVDVKDNDGIPTEYSISQNYPNPFNPTTRLKFSLPKTAQTKLTIYDLLGREVQTLINRELEAGYHEVNFDASKLTSGTYFYRIESGSFVQTKKMILVK